MKSGKTLGVIAAILLITGMHVRAQDVPAGEPSPDWLKADQDVVATLTEELVTFYREMQKKIPTSEIPARALRMLGQK